MLPRERRGPQRACPASRCASPSSQSASGRHEPQAGSWPTAKAASAIISSGPEAHTTVRNMARAESKEADPSDRHTVERGSLHQRRPPLRPSRIAGQHGLPAPQDGQRRVAFDVRIADGTVPALNGRHPPGVVGRLGQGGRQPHRAVPVGRVQEVLQGVRGGSAGLIPVGGPPVQRHDEAGFGAAELAEQELPEQRVVPAPVPPVIQRDHEQAGGLQAPQLPGRARGPQDGIAQRTAQLIEHRRAAQEPLHVLRLAGSGPHGTGSRLRTGHHRSRPAPARGSPSRSTQPGSGRPASPRSVRSPRWPAQGSG